MVAMNIIMHCLFPPLRRSGLNPPFLFIPSLFVNSVLCSFLFVPPLFPLLLLASSLSLVIIVAVAVAVAVREILIYLPHPPSIRCCRSFWLRKKLCLPACPPTRKEKKERKVSVLGAGRFIFFFIFFFVYLSDLRLILPLVTTDWYLPSVAWTYKQTNKPTHT